MGAQDAASPKLAVTLLWARYGVALAALTVTVALLGAVTYKLVMPFSMGFPAGFFQAMALMVLTPILIAFAVEWRRLHSGGGARIARWLGGQALAHDPEDALQRRLLNVVDELVQLEAQLVPSVYVLPQEPSINAFVTAGHRRDMTLCVTQGALNLLTRDELQAMLAHGFARMRELNASLLRQRLAMVWSLSWLHAAGQALMHPIDQRPVSPWRWLAGLGLRAAGWLGWVVGRMLQSSTSAATVHRADRVGTAITDDRLQLGNVLRKLLHDQHMMRSHMRHPSADMLAFLAFHDPVEMPGLATHPTLAERVHLVAGIVLPPLPTTAQEPDTSEPRRASPPASTPQEDADTPERLHQRRLAADREALARLHKRDTPTDTRLAILALMMNPDNTREGRAWIKFSEDADHAHEILHDVRQLLPTSRLPEFERQVDLAATQPLIHKRLLVESARDLMRADGRVSPRERLWWLVLRHRLNAANAPTLMRPVTGQGQTLLDLSLMERAYVQTLSSYVARFIPTDSPAGDISEAGRRWLQAVQARLGEDASLAQAKPPDTDALMHALSGVQELSWMVRPLLLGAWAEEALNHSPNGVLSDNSADALRLLACLLDAPLPPMLASHYPKAA